ncbi:glycosyltransferase family 9 protein [Stutzerimonas nitrititolerans]|uniref:glycosyltransferase family 9 protein n=1 Tax=Stutzerimonas nitrititolerans TaxID=2482751 RepID=UPI00289794D0|nr:glycosyltransferase family 9 protein [Stutzerimonas nitrititolerans]
MSTNIASSQPCDAVPNPDDVFAGLKVAVVPFPALGDITIYLRLCWLFCRSGAHVTFYSNAFYSAREYFPWLTIVPEHDDELDELAGRFELVIACFEKYYFRKKWSPLYAALNNVAFVTAKKISRDSGLDGCGVVIRGKDFFGASRAFCLDSNAGKSMVEWVDGYAKEVFAIETHPMPGLPGLQLDNDAGLVLIFPTTPQPKKNYWMAGFRWLANALQKKGWRVEFVCMPDEREEVLKAVPGFQVRSFPDIKGLIDHVALASIVISNDSGGGHLASFMGLATFTITRRHRYFAWRPGFNQFNTVVYPWFRFKWLGDYIWRPFVPVRLIARKIGRPDSGV